MGRWVHAHVRMHRLRADTVLLQRSHAIVALNLLLDKEQTGLRPLQLVVADIIDTRASLVAII